jgi:aminoglycoside phosphotransferase (APT) family kinase protein
MTESRAARAATPAPDPPELAPVRLGEELDAARVESWIRERMPELSSPLRVEQFPGGHANLTYLLRFGDRELVLRRPPFGPVAPGAHDMVREFRVLSKLWRVFDRAPRAYLLCEDTRVIGAVFFVMERRRGVVIRNSIPAELARHEDVARRVSFALVDAVADLHDVDYAAAGLADLGRPAGFVQRQVEGWYKRWQLAKHAEVPEMEALHAWLAQHLPASPGASLVHNDLKLDNCQFDPDRPDRVKSIFDWDMATLGDPLIDLGTLLGYWSEGRSPSLEAGSVSLVAGPGFPSRDEMAERYAARRDVPLRALDWYEAFALWKTAVVVQQIWIRWKRGQTSDARFARMDQRVPVLARLAAERAGSLRG